MKRSITLIISGAVLVALVAVFIIIKVVPKKPVTAASTTVLVPKSDADKLQSIVLDHDGVTLRIKKAGKDWTVDTPTQFSWDSSSVNGIADPFVSLNADRMVDKSPTDLGQYGLNPPHAKAQATLADGTSIVYLIGDKTPDGGDYYMKKSTDVAVYTVPAFSVTPLLSTIDSLRNKSLPTVDTKTLTYVKIVAGGQTMEMSPLGPGEPLSLVSFSNMKLTKPFSAPRAVDTDGFSKLFTNYPAYLQIQSFVDDHPENLAKYGLAPPVGEYQLKDQKGEEIDLLLGKALPDNVTIYAKEPDNASIFTLNMADVSAFLQATPFGLEDKFLLIPNIDNVQTFTIKAPGVTYESRIQREVEPNAKPDANGKTPTKDTYFFNGKTIEDKPFKDFYQSTIGLLGDAPNPMPRIPFKPEITVTFTLDKEPRIFQEYFVPYNRDFYAAFRDGIADLLVSRTQIQTMLQAASDLAKK